MGSADFPGADISGSVENNVGSVDALATGLADFAWVVVLVSEFGFFPVF